MNSVYLLALFTSIIYSIVYQSCMNTGDLALTFDGGPSPYTGNLLNLLKEKEVKVTFHFAGEYLKTPFISAYVKQAYQDGHLIGLQCKEDLFKVDATNDTFFDHLTKLQTDIQNLINYKPFYLRVPYSSENFPKEIVDKLEGMGFVISISNLDTQDYLYAKDANNKDSIFYNFKNQLDQIVPPAKGSFISTQHDNIAASVKQTDKIIDYLREREYKPVTMSECAQRLDDDKKKGDKKDTKGDKSKKSDKDEEGNKADGTTMEAKKSNSNIISTMYLSYLLVAYFMIF